MTKQKTFDWLDLMIVKPLQMLPNHTVFISEPSFIGGYTIPWYIFSYVR